MLIDVKLIFPAKLRKKVEDKGVFLVATINPSHVETFLSHALPISILTIRPVMHLFWTMFIAVTALFQTISYGQDKEEYTLIKKEGNISIYEKWMTHPSDPDVEVRELKGEFTYNNTVYDGLSLIRDEGKAMEWQSHVSEFKIFPDRDTTTWHEYSYHDIPWPVSDQDHFMEYKLYVRREGLLYITFKSQVNKLLAPERRGVARMVLDGSWTLDQIGPRKVKATYKIISKPGDIPRIFTDPIVRNNIITTLQEFIRLVEK